MNKHPAFYDILSLNIQYILAQGVTSLKGLSVLTVLSSTYSFVIIALADVWAITMSTKCAL